LRIGTRKALCNEVVGQVAPVHLERMALLISPTG
jgi:hypothetical protein